MDLLGRPDNSFVMGMTAGADGVPSGIDQAGLSRISVPFTVLKRVKKFLCRTLK